MTPRALLAPGRLAGRPILRTQSDERLVDLVRAGSEPAFEAIVARYRRPLLRYCSRILNEERAEDAVQQTFVRAYGAMRKNSAELSLKPWLYRIAHNTALNALRDRGLRHEELPEQLDGVERPDQALERSQDLQAVVSAVQELPERQRDAIVLRELEGRSYDEIAAELGVTDGAVRQLLNRARNTLRDAATALTPGWLVARLPVGGGGASAEPVAARVAELCGAGSAGAVAAKVCATALVTGAVVSGGVAVGPDVLPDESARGERPAVGERRGDRPGAVGAARVAPSAVAPAAALGPAPAGARRDGGREDRSGSSGSGSGSSGSGSSGSNSGSGSGTSGSGSGSTGSGSSGSGSSGSGSSGSGSSGSNSGSGSGSSGSGSGSSGSGSGSSGSGMDSGSSGSGSGSSGSGSDSDSSGSGSDSSGSGSSGSGSGDDD